MKKHVIDDVSEMETLLDKLENLPGIPSAADMKELDAIENRIFMATVECPLDSHDPLYVRCWYASGRSLALQSDRDEYLCDQMEKGSEDDTVK